MVLASGGGGNLRFLHNAIVGGALPQYQIAKVVAPGKCVAIEFADTQSIPTEITDFRNIQQLSEAIFAVNPDIVVSTVDKIIPATVLKMARCNFVNLHYSLLPAFKGSIGINTLRRAMDYGSTIVGSTIHEMTEQLDEGRPLFQVAFSINPVLNEEQIMNNMFRSGCLALMGFLNSFYGSYENGQKESLSIFNTSYLIAPPANFPSLIFDENGILWGS